MVLKANVPTGGFGEFSPVLELAFGQSFVPVIAINFSFDNFSVIQVVSYLVAFNDNPAFVPGAGGPWLFSVSRVKSIQCTAEVNSDFPSA